MKPGDLVTPNLHPGSFFGLIDIFTCDSLDVCVHHGLPYLVLEYNESNACVKVLTPDGVGWLGRSHFIKVEK